MILKKNLVGEIFHRLTVISYSHSDNDRISHYLCRCTCGKEKIVASNTLIRGTTKSCGCWNTERIKQNGKEHYLWKGYKEISSTYFGSLKRGAKKRHLTFEVTIEYIWDLFISQNRKCALSGVPLSFQYGQNRSDSTASLDRKNSEIGYIEGNLQWVHKKINSMKMDVSDREFIAWCDKVSEENKKKYEA